MPFGPTPSKLRPGMTAVPARRVNQHADLIGRFLNSRGSGRGTYLTPAGTFGLGDGDNWRIGTTPSAGIPARTPTGGPGSADITETFLTATGPTSATVATGTHTFVGFNLSQQPVAGQALTLYRWISGLWVCVWEDCP